MKKILLFVVLVAMSFGASAQTSEYKQKTKELVEAGLGGFNGKGYQNAMKKTFKSAFAGLGQQLGGEDTEAASSMMDGLVDQVLSPYFENDFQNDMVDALTPVMEKEFTQAEMDELLTIYRDASVQNYLDKISQAGITGVEGMMAEMMPAIMAIAQGQEPTPVSKVDCPADYREAFTQYYQATTGQQLAQALEHLTGDNSGDAATQALQLKIIDYMSENLPEMMLSMYYPTLSKEDLAFGTQFMQNPLVARATAASARMAQDPEAMKVIQQKITGSLMQWIGKLGIQQGN